MGPKFFQGGIARLTVHAAERTLPVNFLVIESRSTFNAIIGRGWIHAMHGVISTLHQVMRCQSPDGRYSIDIQGDHSQAKKCYMISISDRASTFGAKNEEQL